MADAAMQAEFRANNGEKTSSSDTARVLRALRARHSTKSNGLEKWAFFEELAVATGWNQQRIDAWAIGLWPSTRHRLIAYEVKVSRADFMREMRSEWKCRGAIERSHEFYFAAPAGLIKRDELPADAGLIEVGPRGGSRVVVPATRRELDALPLPFVAAISRRVLRGVA